MGLDGFVIMGGLALTGEGVGVGTESTEGGDDAGGVTIDCESEEFVEAIELV